MKKLCPICKKHVDENIVGVCRDAEQWIIDSIRRAHPEWVEKDGTCSKCLDYYRSLGPAGCQ